MLKNRAGFVVPPLVPQNILHSRANPKWSRARFMEDLVKRHGWTKGAELGLWEGVTIGHLLTHCRELHMIGVDLWEPQPDNPGPEGYEGWDHSRHEQRCRAKCMPHVGRYTLFKDYTHEAAKQVEDASLDFVFIDADHSEEGCRRDIVDWLPKIKPTGWILGHDINWPGVLAAVEDLVPGYLIGPNVVWFRPVQPSQGWDAVWRRV